MHRLAPDHVRIDDLLHVIFLYVYIKNTLGIKCNSRAVVTDPKATAPARADLHPQLFVFYSFFELTHEGVPVLLTTAQPVGPGSLIAADKNMNVVNLQ